MLADPSFTEDSLTDSDQAEVIAVAEMMPGSWFVQFDEGSYGEAFARVLPSWSDGLTSAFLLERHHGRVVLTDRLSDPIKDLVSKHDSLSEAMSVVVATVLGSSNLVDAE